MVQPGVEAIPPYPQTVLTLVQAGPGDMVADRTGAE